MGDEETKNAEQDISNVSSKIEEPSITPLTSSAADSSVEPQEKPVIEKESITTDESTASSWSSNSSSSSEPGEGDEDFEENRKKLKDVVSALNKNPLDNLNDEDLLKLVTDLEAEVIHLKTENDLFEKFLLQNDSQLLDGMSSAIENAIKMQGSDSVKRATLAETYSVKSFGSYTGKSESLGATISISEKGPRVNMTQRSDMVLKEMDELNKNLKRFRREAHKKKCYLRAEIEEFGNEIEEITNSLDLFEQTVVIEGVDPLTQRIPAEKFIRFMQEWVKTSSAIVQKFRLKQSTLACQLRKLREVLKYKKELGESLHVVDFEKLQIENQHFITEIDQRTIQLLDLKKMNGSANLMLTNQKKFLLKQMTEMKQIQKDIDDTKIRNEELEREIEDASEQLDKVRVHYEVIKEMIDQYQVPDVMDYVKVKGKLYELRKNIKIWSRRSHLQNVALNSSIREMKNITGSRKVLDSWFKTNQHSSLSDIELVKGNADKSFNLWDDDGEDLKLDLKCSTE